MLNPQCSYCEHKEATDSTCWFLPRHSTLMMMALLLASPHGTTKRCVSPLDPGRFVLFSGSNPTNCSSKVS
ncbi:hypothetical protein BDA96_08G021700 [Sorghum bicolor]|uniref:Uncharacterized protein n=1 Tax=Sorghum bicolor TaxID=4558 RepID=A0A921U6D6_SORBI|nr:hypothetical protein BDA96_08G021700 [Sorghum bicolor]